MNKYVGKTIFVFTKIFDNRMEKEHNALLIHASAVAATEIRRNFINPTKKMFKKIICFEVQRAGFFLLEYYKKPKKNRKNNYVIQLRTNIETIYIFLRRMAIELLTRFI